MRNTKLVRAVRVLGGVRDGLMVSIGILVLASPPPAVETFSDYNGYVPIWGAMFIIGGLVSLLGVALARRTPEVVGCFVTSGAFGLWAAALLEVGTDAFVVGYVVALSSAAVGQVWRGLVVASGSLTSRAGVA